MKNTLLRVLLASLVLPVSNGALAQDDESGVLEEIIVTSTRRERAVMDVNQSIQAVPEAQLEMPQFADLAQIHNLIPGATSLNEQMIMLAVLGLIDVVMISNLLVMVIVGGYETFVSRLRLEGHPDQPEWLSHVNATVLKVKLAMAIIGISSIHLLKTFIAVSALGTDESDYTEAGVMWQTIIHIVFILSALGIAWTGKLMSEAIKSAQHKGQAT